MSAHTLGDNTQISLLEKKIGVGFFSDTIKARSFKLCLITTLLGVYIVILSLLTFSLFQSHCCVRNINCRFCVCVLCSLKVVCLTHKGQILCTIWFALFWCVFKGDKEHGFGQSSVCDCWNLNIGIFSDAINVINVNLCIMVRLATDLDLIQGHSNTKQF